MPTKLPNLNSPSIDAQTSSRTLAEQAYQRLHRALMTGGLLPEQVLTIRGIAESYGVSLTPAREAIQRLCAEGALTSENARTICVPRLDIETYREILKIRLELEAIKAGEAHGTLTANTEFHMSIYRASEQAVLFSIIETLYRRVGPTLNWLFPQCCGSLVGHQAHRSAVDALRRRDGNALAQAIRDDLLHGSSYLLRWLKP